MADVGIAPICSAIADTFKAASITDPVSGNVLRVQDYDELTEGLADMPTLQVYPQGGTTDVATANDRSAFRGRVRQTDTTFILDLYARRRVHIGEDMEIVVKLVDLVIAVLQNQTTQPMFGLTVGNIKPIKSFEWNWARVLLDYSIEQYVGARFELVVRTF